MVASSGQRASYPPDARRAPGGSIDPDRRLSPAEIQKRYRERHPTKIAEKRDRYRARNRDLLGRLKAEPCMDCGGRFPPECMDFDHVRGQKHEDVGRMAMQQIAVERLLGEIAKCDLVCANCHRIRTRHRRKAEGW